MYKLFCPLAAILLLSAAAKAAPAGEAEMKGMVQVPSYQLPLPIHMSPEAKAAYADGVGLGAGMDFSKPETVIKIREGLRAVFGPKVKKLAETYRVDMQEETIGGIHAVVVTPKDGVAPRNRHRVLISLHGGAFVIGDAANVGMTDSIPIAAQLGIKVVSLDYRMGPEFKFPAASQDVAAAYKALLKTYPAKGIGIFGCSAGGILTAQATAWIQQEKLPTPGAIGILCAGADANWAGDSNYVVAAILGKPPLDPKVGPNIDEMPYYGSADLNSPLMSPMLAPSVLAGFPPTLLITGTRSEELGTAANTQRALVNAGVEADLHIWDGMWHAFIGDSTIPEAREAQQVIVRFFDKHLAMKP